MEDLKILESLSYRQEINTKPITNIPLSSNYINLRKDAVKGSPAVLGENTPIIEPETGFEKSEVAGQHLANKNLMIIEEIESLMSQVNEEVEQLEAPIATDSTKNKRLELKRQALEEIDLFQKTTLFKLRKAFE